MKHILIVSIALSLFFSLPAQQDIDSFKNEVAERLSFFPEKTEIAVAIIKNDSTQFFGWRKEGSEMQPVNNANSVFEIGSITKVFTSIILANGVLAQQVTLDETVNDYIDFDLPDNIQFTFKQLANHTSGLPRMPDNFSFSAMKSPLNPFKSYDEELLNKYLSKTLKLVTPAGETYAYSNLGAGLLGHLMTKISKTSYEQLLDSLITEPYKMTQTTTIRSNISDHLVTGLNAAGKDTPNWDFQVIVAAGGILSSVHDLSLFARAQFDLENEDLKLTQQTTFEGPSKIDMGLGWHIVDDNSEALIIERYNRKFLKENLSF